MSCNACEESQEAGSVAYYRIDAANIALLGCNEHLAIALRRMNAHDDLVAALEEAAGHFASLAQPPAGRVLHAADLNTLEARELGLRRLIAAARGSEVPA